MADACDASDIEGLPIPKERAVGGDKFVTVWTICMENLKPGIELLCRIESLDKALSVSVEHRGGNDLVLTVTRGRGTSHEDRHLAACFALQRLEELAGSIALIEGLPRETFNPYLFRTLELLDHGRSSRQ